MLRLDDLALFVSTADHGSLSAAARKRDVSPAVASAALKRLEQQLDTRLFVRSTRSLRLTPEGEQFLAHARSALESLTEGQRQLAGGREDIAGMLQLSAPSDFGRNVLLPWLDDFQREHPRLGIRLHLSDSVADLFRQAVDIAIRYGEPEDSSLVALPLVPGNRRVLCAAPAYLERHGRPHRLEELSGHNCLLYQLGGRVHDRWTVSDGRREQVVTVTGNRVCDNADVVRRWALSGQGIIYKSWLDVADDVRAGRLELVLPQYLGQATPLNLICAHRAQLSKPVRLLREFVQARCARLLVGAPWS